MYNLFLTAKDILILISIYFWKAKGQRLLQFTQLFRGRYGIQTWVDLTSESNFLITSLSSLGITIMKNMQLFFQPLFYMLCHCLSLTKVPSSGYIRKRKADCFITIFGSLQWLMHIHAAPNFTVAWLFLHGGCRNPYCPYKAVLSIQGPPFPLHGPWEMKLTWGSHISLFCFIPLLPCYHY